MDTPFRNLLLSRGFVLGASGRFVSPDFKYGDGIAVELVGTNAIAFFKGGRTLYEASKPADVEKFRQEVR